MNKIVILLFATIFFSHPAFAICDHIYLETISADGSLLKSNEGKVWVANSNDNAVGWGLNDDVIMCGDGIMINHDQNERISVTRIK